MDDSRLEIEAMLIGALLSNPSGIIEADLKEADFKQEFLGWCFAVMKRLYTKKQTFGLLDFASEVADDQFDYLRDCVSLPVNHSSGTIRDYCLYIQEANEKAAWLNAAMSVTPHMPLAQIREIMSVAKSSEKQSKVKTGQEVLEEIKADLTMTAQCDRTGLVTLDKTMGGGLYKGFVYGFCGAEKSGKTTLAHTISYNLDQGGVKHLYVALEMGSKMIEQRNIARQIGVNSLEFLANRAGMAKLIDRAEPRKNTLYLDAPGASLDEIISEMSKCLVGHKIRGAIIDYWQLVSQSNARQTEEKHLRDVAQGLADFAKRHGIWIIILAQMNADGKLFGGGGLKKACEQLYMIKTPEGDDNARWLQMDASRYTLKADVGSDLRPPFMMDISRGPHFYEI